MKNLVYLMRTTRERTCPHPRVFVGATNFLHRQIAIHQHRWQPAERQRQRAVLLTPKKWRYHPMAVITGFPCPSLAAEFVALMTEHQFEALAPLAGLRTPARLDQVEYRVRQMACATDAMLSKYRDQSDLSQIIRQSIDSDPTLVPLADRSPQNSVDDVLARPLQLTIHWDREETMQLVQGGAIGDSVQFPFDVTHEMGIDVRAIDDANVDAYDTDDDRNYWRLKRDAEKAKRLRYLQGLATELNIPMDQLQVALTESRELATRELTKRGGKQGRKARTRIPTAPHGKHTDFENYVVPQ